MAARSMVGFNSKYVPHEVREKYHERFWSNIEDVLKTRKREMAKAIWGHLNPRYSNKEDYIKKLEDLVTRLENLDAYWQKNLKEDLDMAHRLNKVLKFAEEE